jgi:hypothetical protein
MAAPKKSAAPAKKTKSTAVALSFRGKAKRSRKGIHAKTKMSKNKSSKNYIKRSVGQG